MSNESPSTPEDKTGVLVRIPNSKIERFKELQPWHGAMTQFFLQALDVFLDLQKDHKTAAQLTTEAVQNVVRESY